VLNVVGILKKVKFRGEMRGMAHFTIGKVDYINTVSPKGIRRQIKPSILSWN